MAQHFEEFYSNTFNCMMKQVGVSKARKAFNEGITVYFLPSKMRFDNVWQSPVPIVKGNFADFKADPFEVACNYFRNSNCDSERGKNIHYFIQVK